MMNDKPLALSREIVNSVCEPLMCASQASDWEWKQQRAADVDELIRPLVDALEDLIDQPTWNRTLAPYEQASLEDAREALQHAKGE